MKIQYKKYLIPIFASFLIVSAASAYFRPATLLVETWNGLKRQAVYTKEQADKFFKQGYKLDQGQTYGSSITTINATDTLKDSRTTINDNFTALNAGKIENASTSIAAITTLNNLTSASSLATIGTITTGVWSGTAIAVGKGGTGTTSPSQYQIILGNGSAGLTVASSTGTSGQFLTSNGTAAYPNWTTSSIDQSLNYTWTGNHYFNNTAASTTVIGKFTIGSTTQAVLDAPKWNTLTQSSNADTLHTHNYSGLLFSTTTDATWDITGESPPRNKQIMATTTIAANTLSTNKGFRVRVNFSSFPLSSNGIGTFGLIWGSTNLSATIPLTSNLGNTTSKGYFEATVLGAGATNAQETILSTFFTNSDLGIGATSTAMVFGTAAEDSAAAKNIAAYYFGFTAANNILTVANAFVELLK